MTVDKRGRGRPRKLLDGLAVTSVETEQSNIIEQPKDIDAGTSTSVNQLEKESAIHLSAHLSDGLDNGINTDKKGRGRPRKEQNQQSFINSSVSVPSINLEKNDTNNPVVAKGRGRPKKLSAVINLDLQNRLHDVANSISSKNKPVETVNVKQLEPPVLTPAIEQKLAADYKAFPVIPSSRKEPEIGNLGKDHMDKIFKEIGLERRVAPTLEKKHVTSHSTIDAVEPKSNLEEANSYRDYDNLHMKSNIVVKKNHWGSLIFFMFFLIVVTIGFLSATGKIDFDNLLNSIKSLNPISPPIVTNTVKNNSDPDNTSFIKPHVDVPSLEVPTTPVIVPPQTNAAILSQVNAPLPETRNPSVISSSTPAPVSSVSVSVATPDNSIASAPPPPNTPVVAVVSTPTSNLAPQSTTSTASVSSSITSPNNNALSVKSIVNLNSQEFIVPFVFGNITSKGLDTIGQIAQMVKNGNKIEIYYFSKTLKTNNFQPSNLDTIYFESEILASNVSKELMGLGIKKENILVPRARSYALAPEFKHYYQDFGYALVRIN